MNTTYTLTEGNNAANRALLMMRYDLGKTLNENVVLEQPESRSAFGHNPWSKDPNQSAIAAMERQSQYIKDVTEFIENNKHGILQVAAIGSLFIPIVGPAISLGLDLVDTSLYYSEGDNYMAGFSLAFAMIPGSALIAKIPAVKQIGKKGLIKILKLASNPKSVKTLNKVEQEAIEQITKNSKWITLTAAKEITKKMAKLVMVKIKLPEFVRLMIKFNIKNPIKSGILNAGLQIGGITYGWNQLANLYGINEKGEYVSQQKTPKNEKIKVSLETKFEQNKEQTSKQFEETVKQSIINPEDASERDKILAQFFKE
jgi:hypothetical protein